VRVSEVPSVTARVAPPVSVAAFTYYFGRERIIIIRKQLFTQEIVIGNYCLHRETIVTCSNAPARVSGSIYIGNYFT
jgi:formate/nitrite transporter FocA (FNT family)